MIINTARVELVLMNKAIPANYLESEIGISRSAITRVRNDERKIENLKLETIIKVQKWIDSGKYTFSYDYSDLIEELEEDIAKGLAGKYIYVVRGPYNEILEKCPIIDYYYTSEEIEEGELAEKTLTASVLAEMKSDNEIF
ncbi:ORF57 [Streptococcus phage 01205]|uniref:ORF57 n=1 Tax=Streptococcus phage O1205 TaxID=85154 RepID=O34088_BPO12|nr:ORF57 [Streptococcus phage 01205]AAC79573.1 ORF57 [Streptococcus phage 01205]